MMTRHPAVPEYLKYAQSIAWWFGLTVRRQDDDTWVYRNSGRQVRAVHMHAFLETGWRALLDGASLQTAKDALFRAVQGHAGPMWVTPRKTGPWTCSFLGRTGIIPTTYHRHIHLTKPKAIWGWVQSAGSQPIVSLTEPRTVLALFRRLPQVRSGEIHPLVCHRVPGRQAAVVIDAPPKALLAGNRDIFRSVESALGRDERIILVEQTDPATITQTIMRHWLAGPVEVRPQGLLCPTHNPVQAHRRTLAQQHLIRKITGYDVFFHAQPAAHPR